MIDGQSASLSWNKAFSLPRTTHRVTVEVFDPASTWVGIRLPSRKVKFTLRLMVGRSVSQSVSQPWCQAQSGAHDQIFITV
jgi:hypothetical protein